MKLPEINELIMWDNRFGIVLSHGPDHLLCRGLANEPLYVAYKEFDYDRVFTNIATTDLYDFQEAIGENVYDPLSHVTNCRVLETAKVINPVANIEYLVTLHDYVAHTIVVRAIRRYGDNHLYWAKA
jgi:hypothetical protein